MSACWGKYPFTENLDVVRMHCHLTFKPDLLIAPVNLV